MTTEVLTQLITAGKTATFGSGRLWYLLTATTPISVTAESTGTGAKVRKFSGIPAGFKFAAKEGDGWSYLRVTSALTQTITIVIGDDDVEFANAVTVNGSVNVVGTVNALPNPSTTITASGADISVSNAAAVSVGANGRLRMTVGATSTNTGSLRIQTTGAGANRGIELTPGNFVEIASTSAFDVRNDSGAVQKFWLFEES